jgi:leucyl aminopeptidase
MITIVEQLGERKTADLMIVPFFRGKKTAEEVASFKEAEALIAPCLESGDFSGKEGDMILLYPSGKQEKEKRILCLGLGDEKSLTREICRRAFSDAVKLCQRKKFTAINLFIPKKIAHFFDAICEGLLLTNYAYFNFKNAQEQHPLLKSIGIICPAKVDSKKIETIVSAVNFTRDLINGNADEITTDALVKVAEELCKKHKTLKKTILRKKELEKEKMGLLLAVSRGSLHEPALIILEYRGNPQSKEITAVVGKGITYDTGGLHLKQTGMDTMKSDMAGGATVFGLLKAAAELKLKANIIGVITTAENAIGPSSYKLGDVYTSHLGKSVEIADTDAEGRLVLADALSYLQKHYTPTRIIDLATLTGGIVVALGEEMTGLFSNDDKLAHALIKAGEATFERLWRMPLLPEYKDHLKSHLADIKNSAGRKASSATGAIFIYQFVKNVPWAHLDIAGTAYLPEPKHYHTTLATGVGVRLLIELLS